MKPSRRHFLAWLVALVASLSALFIGEVMGQFPCVLCWYQRIAMFPLVLVLGIGLWSGDGAVARYGLPLSLAGVIVAGWHSLLFYDLIPAAIVPCTASGISCSGESMAIAGLPLPLLSLVAFLAISGLLAASWSPKHE